MGKEIERKFTVKPTIDIKEFLELLNENCNKKSEIKDYYFNPTTRLRFVDGKAFITVKSLNMMSRDEYEFKVNKSSIDFIPSPILIKTRYYIKHEGHVFEVNVYDKILDKNNRPLILVEVEVQDENEKISLPDWIDHEVTYHPAFYNYNIFAIILKDSKNSV